ncbi:ion transporter [Limnohabitans sp. 103DPR2]|uniref:ion transporter n=1 Tax=Limnohabitans sp. 103DPR2 TaxID=1678129 RepID=UPI0006DC95FB|nr:ion transporter [Limnohabitans sp. 103DPR2]ALK91548.1 Cyclic nucleotide-gated potassium channel [Limnohabitans sp. 103DPR2]
MATKNIEAQLLSHEAEISSDLPFRKWLYAWLLDPHIEGNYHKTIEHWIGLLIVANLFALVFEHLPAVYEPNQIWFHYFDVASVIIFSIEYVLRLYLAPEDDEFKKHRFSRLRYVSSPFAVIDLIAILPFFLQAFISIDLRFLRFLRLLRILKLFRVLIPAVKEFVAINKGRTFRQKVHALVFPSEYGGELHHMFDTFIVIWVVISVIAVVLESVQSIHYLLNLEFLILDAIAVSVFTLEYCLRLYCCVEEPGYQKAITGRLKLAKSTSSVIDLLAIAPFFLEVFLHHLFDLRFMRVFRLLRLLKLTRYTGATQSLSKVIAREWPVMAASAFIMLLLVVMTASLGYLFEHEAQPDKFENIPQSIYWAVVTLASVGYGDISPITPAGRAMTIVLALIGIGIFAIPAALLSAAFADQLKSDREALVNTIYEMLADGVIDDDEAHFIKTESKRLHLTDDDLRRLVDKAKKERELMDDVSILPLHKIASNPEHTIEHFKYLLGQIRQLNLLADQEQLNETLDKPDRLTSSDKQLWRLINRQEAPPT